VQFLTEQANKLQSEITAIETAIERIKAENGGALTAGGMPSFGMQSGNYDTQIIMLRRENITLNAQRESRKTSAERDPLVATAEAELAAAQARYSENHPDIAIAKRRLTEARRLAAANLAKLPEDTIDEQIASNNAQIAALQTAKAQESARATAVQGAQARAPLILEEVAQRQQRLDALNMQYERVSTRLMAAQVTAKAETEQKGEKLSVIDPPIAPEDPVSPNRQLLISGGLGLGLGIGFLVVLLVELIQRPVRDAIDIEAITGTAPLVTIPTIAFISDKPSVWKGRLLGLFREFGRRSKEQVQ
jgi:uncharacterized protein involved in exopolysaccharide biosynthesis